MLEVFHDPFGKRCQEIFEDKTMDKRPQQVTPTVKPPIVVEDVRVPKVDPTLSKRLEETKLVEKVCLFITFLIGMVKALAKSRFDSHY